MMFQRDQKGFFRTLEEEEAREREMPLMEKFVEFLGKYVGKKRKDAKHAMDGRDKETVKSESQSS